MDYSTFLDRLRQWRIPVRQIGHPGDLSEDTLYRYIREGKRLPGEAIYRIAEDRHMSSDEVSLELLGIEPSRSRPQLTDEDLISLIRERIGA